MFPTSILQGTYNQSSGSGSSTDINSVPATLGHIAELNSKLYSPSADTNIYESTNSGTSWSNFTAVTTSLHNAHTYSIVTESNRLVFADNSLDIVTFDGVNNVSTINWVNSGNTLVYIRKLGSRYYVSENASGGNATYYTTSSALNTGWTSVGTGTASKWIEEGNGAEIYDNGSKLVRSTNGFSTSTDIFGFITATNVQLLTDGNNNWVRFGGGNQFRISTDNGVNWTNKYMIEAGGSYPSSIVRESADTGSSFYYNNKFYFLNSNSSNGYTPGKRFYSLPTSEFSSTYPEVTVEYDFNVSTNSELQGQGYTTIIPLYITRIGTKAYVSAFDNSSGGTVTPLLFIIDL